MDGVVNTRVGTSDKVGDVHIIFFKGTYCVSQLFFCPVLTV